MKLRLPLLLLLVWYGSPALDAGAHFQVFNDGALESAFREYLKTTDPGELSVLKLSSLVDEQARKAARPDSSLTYPLLRLHGLLAAAACIREHLRRDYADVDLQALWFQPKAVAPAYPPRAEELQAYTNS